MKGKVNCTCGWSWNKSDSSAKDMYICHECGRDNSNNMKNGGWMDNYNDSKASAPEGMVGDGFSNVGRNYSPAWGGQFQEGGEIPKAQVGTRADSLALYNNALAKIKFYKGNSDYVQRPSGTNFKSDELRKKLIKLNKNLPNKKIKKQFIDNLIQNAEYDNKPLTPAEKSAMRNQTNIVKFGPVSGTNLTSFGDILSGTPDTYFNPLAPPIYLHPNISPQGSEKYYSRRFGDSTDIPYYDPIAVAPFDIVKNNPKLLAERIKKYGTKGVPQSYINQLKDKPQDKPQDKPDKKRPKVEALQPLTPQPVISNLFSDAKLPVIIPDARIPKYYDVDFQAHTIPGGRMTFHDRHEGTEQMSLEELTKWLRLQELMNQGYDERYRWDNLRERFPNHPQEWIDKQTEKLKAQRAALDVKLTATPHYQTGGQFENGGLIPIAQDGRATRADSLGLYNHSKKVENFYNNKGYRKSVIDPAIINFLKNHKVKELNDIAAKKYDGKATPVDADTATLLTGITKNQYRKTIDKNKYLQRELQTNTINASAPMQLFDNRIEPKGVRSYYRSDGDGVDVFSYNTIANKPFDLLTPKEKIQRVKEFGTSGVPKSYLNKIKSTTTKETTKPTIEKREPVQSLTPLQPIGIQNDFNIEASLPVIRPDAKIPKSYDVSTVFNSMKGPTTGLRFDREPFNRKEATLEQAMQILEYADKYNANIQKKYGPEGSYYTRNSPRLEALAADRANKIKLEVAVKPNYQMGGNVYPVNYVPQAQDGEKTYSYPLRDKLYPGEDKFFKENPHVGGMAAEDNQVIINPYSPLSNEEKEAVRMNETARLAMRNGYTRPTFDLTPEQQEAFKDYSTDEQDQRETIIGRIISGDPSAKNVTPEQKKYAEELQKVLKFQGGGSIPGSVGFTYARTKGIPSNGPYAKKTMASAQGGKKIKIKDERLEGKIVKDNTATKKPIINEKHIIKELKKIDTNQKKIENAKAYYKKYLNSPKARERITNMMDDSSGSKYAYLYDDEVNPVDQEIKNRLAGLNKLQGKFEYANDFGTDSSSYYDTKKNSVFIRPNSDINVGYYNNPEYTPYRMDVDNTIGHEIGHGIQQASNKNSNNIWFSNGISKKESDMLMRANMGIINAKNREEILKDKDNPELKYDLDHDNRPSELKADIDALRYQLYRQGVYDAGTQDFTREHLEKAKPSFTRNRLKEHFTDDELIDLMNKLSYNEINSDGITSIAQNGVDMYNNPILGRENLIPGKGRSNYNPRTNILNLYDEDPIYDQTRAHENYHARQFAEGRSNFDIGNNTENAFWALMQKRPEVSSTDEVFENYHNRKQKELELDRPEMVRILPETRFMPPKIIDKYTDRNGLQYRNAYSVEGEAQFYGETGEEFHKLPKGQNGKEMQYYQEGLDWKPKTISKNGGWLDQYDEAQDGGEVAQDGWNAAQLKLLKKIKPQNNVVIDTNGVKFDMSGKRVLPNSRFLQILDDVLKRKQQFSNVKVKDERAEAVTKVDNTRTASKPKVTDIKKLNVRNKTKAELAEIKRKNDEAIIADRKARMADAMKAQDEDIIGNPNWKKVLARETQSTGDKFRIFPNDADSFIDNWLNPGVMIGDMVSGLGAAPYEMERQESMMPLLTGIGAPLLAGALGGIGAKTNKQFINNIFNPVNIVPRSSSAEKYIGNKLKTAIPVSIKSNLKKGIEKVQKSNTYKALDEHLSGIEEGLFYDKRPFFEKFPITKAQKAKVYAAQDKAFEEGQQFIKDWHYGDDIDLHPDIVDKMKELDPDFKLSVFDNTNITNTSGPYANPFAKTKNVLLSTRRNALKNENISDYAKEYMLKERNKFRGVSLTTDENLTLRNAGLYHFSPEQVKSTGMHELGHTAEGLGTMTHWDPNGNLASESIPFDRIRTYDPNFTDYNMANLNTDQGKLFQEAMIEPTPHIFDADGNITKRGYTWAASPGELHSELLPARSNLIDAYVAQGHDRKEIMNMIRAGVSDAQIDWMIDNKDLNRFFKPTTSPELKRKVIRMLYAGVPAAVGLDALMESDPNESSSGMKRQGGIIKDDRGQWDHPGEITEIGSNQITMQGVPYDVLGISDTGDTKLMKPGKNYKFKGKKVTEFPMAKNGMRQEQKGLVNLDNLLNFTNYNKPQPGGWLNKYN